MFAQSLVLFLLSGFWFLTTVNSAPHEFSPLETGLIFSLVGGVFSVQAFVLFLAARIKTAARRFVLRFESLAAFFAVVNLFCLNLSFAPGFVKLGFAACALLLIAAWFLGSLFFAAMQSGNMRKYAATAAAFLFLYQAAVYANQTFFTAAAELSPPPPRTSSENIRVVGFKQKPNVYFFMFESLLPPPVLQMDLRLHASYDDYLRELGFRRFKNAFSDGLYTTDSASRLLAMDAGYLRALAARNLQNDLFSGRAPSPLFEIFHANGYSVGAYNRDFTFGAGKGRFIDDYWLPVPLAMCFNLRIRAAFRAGFFGYCPLTEKLAATGFHQLMHKGESAEDIYQLIYRKGFVELYLKDIALKLADGKPWFFFARVKTADHVLADYDGGPETFAAFRALYDLFGDSTKDAAGRIVRHVRKNDPDALMFFFGDHGAKFSFEKRGWAVGLWKDAKTEEDKKLFVRDHYGVYAAFSPADACRDYFQPAPGGFFTTAMIARQIVRCLADGDDPANETITYPLRPVKGKEPDSYRDYLYEEN